MASEFHLDILLEQLNSDDPNDRREACVELAKLGDPAAIVELRNVYQSEDEDPKVKAAAEKALIKFAKESATSSGGGIMRALATLLTLSLLVLIALNVVLRLGGDSDPEPVVEDTTPSDLNVLLDGYTNDKVFPLFGDITALRTEWESTDTLPCAATFTRVEPIALKRVDRATYPDLALVTPLNEEINALNTLITDWESTCESGGEINPDQKDATLDAIGNIELALIDITDDISNAQNNPQPTLAFDVLPTDVPTNTPEPTNTPTETPTPRPTFDPSVVTEMNRRINNTRSAVNQLKTSLESWRDTGGSAFGCSVGTIPEDYTDAPAGALELNPDLQGVIDFLNDTLTSARDVTSQYGDSCGTEALQAVIPNLLANIDLILSNLDVIEEFVETL